MAWLAIIGLSIVASIVYGLLHDQVTVRVCVEYFTIGHPRVFDTDSPTLLAMGWGIIATWWMGGLLGIPLALSARAGSRPKLGSADLLRPVAALLLMTGAVSLIAGVTGYFLARSGAIGMAGRLASTVPVHRHAAYLADFWAHMAAYVFGALGGLGLCVRTWRRRGRMAGDP